MDQRIFKSHNGIYFTKQLFLETADKDTRDLVLYSLKDQDQEVDGRTYPSLRRLYLELSDESEYEFANLYFDGWSHYKKLLATPWFVDYLSSWREELILRQKAKSLSVLKAKADTGDVATAKYLLERNWEPKSSVGRPSKAAIRRKAQELLQDSGDISEDFKRLSALPSPQTPTMN